LVRLVITLDAAATRPHVWKGPVLLGGHDPYPALASAIIEAQRRYDQDGTGPAARILRQHLRDIDPATAPPHPRILAAALLYAMWADEDDDSQLRWAWYGYRSTLLLTGDHDNETVTASTVLAGVLHDRGDFTLSAVLWEVIAARHQQAARHLEYIDARLLMAEALHATGSCGAAVQHATAALDTYPPHQELTGYAVGLLERTLLLLDLCDRTDEALALLRQWQPRLPSTQADPRLALMLGTYRIGSPLRAQNHHQVCAARLSEHLNLLHTDRPRECPVHLWLRRTAVRRAFLDALGAPDDTGTPDPEPTRCTCTTPAAPSRRRRITPESLLENLIALLIHLRIRLSARKTKRLPPADAPDGRHQP
jgi:hypothetical protein